jgi:hypothetical protein
MASIFDGDGITVVFFAAVGKTVAVKKAVR